MCTREKQCPVPKAGTDEGEATMFQEEWVHGKTGACGFESPFSDHGTNNFERAKILIRFLNFS